MSCVLGGLSLAVAPAIGDCLVYDGTTWVPRPYGAQPAPVPQTYAVTVDFGALPKAEAEFSVPTPGVLPTQLVSAQIAGTAPGKDADEVGMDSYHVTAVAETGTVLFYVRGLEGYLADKFNIVYTLT